MPQLSPRELLPEGRSWDCTYDSGLRPALGTAVLRRRISGRAREVPQSTERTTWDCRRPLRPSPLVVGGGEQPLFRLTSRCCDVNARGALPRS
eukprot:scaffold55_cov401-Prasinococcus_capsulatus_cf.AAC.10